MTPAATLLTVETEARLRDIGEVDILIGIPSYNNAKTIGHVVRAVMAGLAKYFSGRRSVLVNSDGGSVDGTPDVVGRAVVDSDLRSITPEWIELLIGPVLNHGYDYVAPYYLRHKYDGTITNSIVYP